MASEMHPPTILKGLYEELLHHNLLPEFLKKENGETYFQLIVLSWVVMGVLILISFIWSSQFKRIPGRMQALMETVVESLGNMLNSLIGHDGRKYLGLLGTTFIFILCLNIIGLIPGLISPTANWNCTVSMAIVMIVMVQIYGLKEHGFWGYLKHYMGSPKELATWLIAPLILVVDILSEMIRVMSLSLRLYVNIFGEDMIIISLVNMGLPLILLQIIMFCFAVFTSFLQAFIFTALSAIYIKLITSHE
ncbi:MAG: F0F1 ATP synthase subunit A [Planctomycetota bacterium]